MASMNVSIPDSMRDWVQSLVDSGLHASANDYVRDLIRRDQEAASQRQLTVEEIRRSIEDGRLHGRTRSADQVFEQIEGRLKRTVG